MLQERWSLLWRLSIPNPSPLYPIPWAHSISKGLCSVFQQGGLGEAETSQEALVEFCDIPLPSCLWSLQDVLWWDEALEAPGMVLGSWLEHCSGAEVPVGRAFPTILLWLPQPARTGSCLLLSGPAMSVDFQWSFTCATYPSLSWILESLYHISAIALFVRNEKVSLEPWWLYLPSLNT